MRTIRIIPLPLPQSHSQSALTPTPNFKRSSSFSISPLTPTTPLTPLSPCFPFAPSSSSSAKFPANYVRSDKIKLKKVLGLTVCSNAALDVSPVSGLLAYPAGCTIVLFNAKRQTQAYLVNTSRKAFTAVAFSRCGRYVATGECGINPAIKVWELESPNGNLEHTTGGNVIAEFVDHKNSVTCVAFSPTGKYLVSVGSQHDMIVNVFDWKSNLKIASNKISSKVWAVSFAEDGSYFVTVGVRHVKYWYLEGSRKYKDPIPLMGRSAILGDLRDNDFCAVACGKGKNAESTYAITRQGHLVEFSSRRLLDKWVQCRTTSANCLCVNGQFILVGCAESIIRIFNAATLEYVTTLPRTHYLGVDVAQGIHINHIMTVPQNAKYPDCIAMVYDEQRSKVSCVYNDHSLYIWDMRDIKRVGKSHSFLYHSTCIWGVETVPYNMERDVSHTLPEDSFMTCSSDDTIRVWGLDGCPNTDVYRRNIYSKDLLKVIYSDDELNFIKDQESTSDKGLANSTCDGRNGVRCIKISPELQHLASGDRCGNIRIYSLGNAKLITTIEAHESEVLCLEYSNEKIDRKLLASASRDRLIHVFDVAQDYLLLQTLDDHSSSITSIKFVGTGLNFQMISCGADKSIMFRTFQGNIFLRGTHTSGKTTLYDMEVDSNAKHILTACQDRNIRVYGTQNAKHTKTFKGSHSDEGSLIKLSLDPSGIYVATSCTDKTLAVYDYYSNECMARMYGHSELVTGLKFTNDCRHLISASGDGCIFIWQVPHDMIVTMQARLSQQRLRSGHAPLQRPKSALVSPEGILIESPTREMEHFPAQQKYSISPSVFAEESPLTPGYRLSDVGQLPQWAKRKAFGSNPASDPPEIGGGGGIAIPTAQTIPSASSITNLSSSPSQLGGGLGGVPRARGRWAQRGQFDPDDIRSNSESPLSTITTSGGVTVSVNAGLGNTQTSDYNSASSKDIMYNQTYLSEDSSIDSGMETRRELKFATSSNSTTTTITMGSSSSNNNTTSSSGATTSVAINSSNNRLMPDKRKSGLRFDPQSNEHDGDVEDISDGERTSSDHGGMFYNNISPSTPTDFKVTAMNEEELRKSVRRQKFEKSGLALNNNGAHTAASTGTGTSDTEDEGSTPSAENAERSLASTLGGSMENISQATSSFLQAALPDGPEAPALQRGSSNRRSISAKHNTENGKVAAVANQPTITKSYTNTKKEELMKVINEARQKLENVGYRSLRGSHSISDLSLAGTLDGSRQALGANRYSKPVPTNVVQPNSQQYTSAFYDQPPQAHYQQQKLADSKPSASHPPQQQPPQQLFFNCAASKSVLQQNCQAMRQVQQHYPPYPHHVGVHQIHPPPGVPFMRSTATAAAAQLQQNATKPFTSATLPSKTPGGNIEALRAKRNAASNNRRTTSILKHYKSCPVSPVHEEVEWTNTDNKSIIITEPKRHSVYAEDARSILDMIQTDTEKMIEEITRKYGDLDDISVDVYDAVRGGGGGGGRISNSYSMPANLSQPCTAVGTPPTPEIREIRGVPYTIYNAQPPPLLYSRRHQQQQELSPNTLSPSKRATSEYYIYEEYYHCKRKVSLSDILNDNPEQMTEARRIAEARFLETQRHSSASFFLGPHQYADGKSQESLLSSEEYGIVEGANDGGSCCNSLESILSDESDCKSAPDVHRHAGIRNFIIHGPVAGGGSGGGANGGHSLTSQLISKSYGSSPNAYNSFDYFMQQRGGSQMHNPNIASLPYDSFDVSNYDLSAVKQLPTATKTYPRTSAPTSGGKAVVGRVIRGKADDIPTLSSKNKQYNSGVNKSLSQDFAQNRQIKGGGTMDNKQTNDEMLFVRKNLSGKPPIPVKPQNLVSTLTSNVERGGGGGGGGNRSDSMKKSCSFEVKGAPISSRTASVVRKFERNLEKFEREKQDEMSKKRDRGMRSSVSSSALATQSCLKKVSKFDKMKPTNDGGGGNDGDDDEKASSRRATSMRTRPRPKISVRFNTVSQIKYTPCEKRNATMTTTTTFLNDINRNERTGTHTSSSSSSSMINNLSNVGGGGGEKSFELYITGNGNEHENMNMDSLKLYTKPELQAVVDEIKTERARDAKLRKNLTNEERTSTASSSSNDASTTNQCKNIAKKIDIIQKLIEMEERKLEQIRLATESRMRPFECNSKEKGYVKSLTMNFDMLAKGIEKDIVNEQRRLMRNDSSETDLCANGRHIKRNVSLPDVLESTDIRSMHPYMFRKEHDDGEMVELATEVKADSDTENETAAQRRYVEKSEHDSEKIRNDCIGGYKQKGNPKNLNPMPIEESSIRRACSLSDLHMGNFGKGGKSNGSQQKSSAAYRNSSASRSSNKRNSLQLKGSTGNLGGQSNSIGLLNQGSDSENEDINRGRSAATSGQNRSNGPNAQNRQYGSKNAMANNRSRKGLQTNFSNATPLQDDSSSEETPGVSSGGKPTVPPRPRNLTFDHKIKLLNNAPPNANKQRGIGNSYDNALESPLLESGDPKSQVHNVINKLYTTTQTVMQLHANLKNCEDSLMLKELENAVIMTQNMLTNITQNKNDKTNAQQSCNNSNYTGNGNGNGTNAEQTNLDNGEYLMMVNNCADLLSNFRMKHKPDDCENNS